MKWHIKKFYITEFSFQDISLNIVNEYLDYILQPSKKNTVRVDSIDKADTVFMFYLNDNHLSAVTNKLSDEWYQIVTEDCSEKKIIKIEAKTDVGLKWGITDLIRKTVNDGISVYIEFPINISSEPTFSKRGLHLNGWVFDHPYSFRTWSVTDWKNYIDILILFKINLLMIWPFMETIPLSLSDEDEKYLMDYREITDHAHKKGMEVWVFISVNRVCVSNDGISDPRLRPYWYAHLQADMDPGEPDEFDMIYRSREIFHRYLNNADGYCIIDSDPGCWVGSTTEEYIKICETNRKLIDKYNVFGRDAKMIFWLWGGWGIYDTDINYVNMMNGIKEKIHEPWLLMAAKNNINKFLEYDKNLSHKLVYIPYEAIEEEPSIPFTNNDFNRVVSAFKVLNGHKDIYGVMGNTQTPYLQLPNTAYFSEMAWSYPYGDITENELVKKLSAYIFPGYAGILEKAWTILEAMDPEKVSNPWLWEGSPVSLLKSRKIIDTKAVWKLISGLEDLAINIDTKKAGYMGRKITPSPVQIVEDLLLQLKIAISAEEAYLFIHPDTPRASWLEKIEVYFGYVAEMAQKTGYGKGILPPRHWMRFKAVLKENIHLSRRYLEFEELMPMRERLRGKYGKRIADHLVCMLHNDLLIDKFDIRAGG
jgi:hypothetical protein